jgi:hypothetical protein
MAEHAHSTNREEVAHSSLLLDAVDTIATGRNFVEAIYLAARSM